jgi:hypothetical protein
MNGLVLAVLLTVFSMNLGSLSQAQTPPSSCQPEAEAQADEIPKPEVSLSTLSAATEDAAPTFAVGVKWLDELYSIACYGDGFSTRLTVDLESTLGDNHVFGGAMLFLQGYHTRFPTATIEVPDIGPQPLRDTSKLQHMFALSSGVQTDAGLQNISLLVEIGYVPLYAGIESFRLGPSAPDTSWLDAGAFLQAGYTANTSLGSAVTPAQDSGKALDASGALLRLKLGGRSGLQLPVTLPNIQALRLQSEAWVWYDVLENQVHGLLEGALSLDITKDVSYNVFNVTHGSAPPAFVPGTQFGTGLTIRF